jgi:reactive intermediate/imine deaminase
MSKKPLGTRGAVPLSPGWRAGDFVFTSGQVPADDQGKIVEGDIETQTHAVMKRIEAVLAEGGCSLEDVIKTTVWLEDARDFARFNATYATYFPNDPPARTTVESRLMIDIKIEIEAIAYKPQS